MFLKFIEFLGAKGAKWFNPGVIFYTGPKGGTVINRFFGKLDKKFVKGSVQYYEYPADGKEAITLRWKMPIIRSHVLDIMRTISPGHYLGMTLAPEKPTPGAFWLGRSDKSEETVEAEEEEEEEEEDVEGKEEEGEKESKKEV
ncbi:uncharacterized protein VTP21DRAFT_6159 [Calcarisporiella thermophila]|uniref:uncharacterized protein n=1 Tax=Calcarisporiella thermophila TaxID=911321 RepID=UPI0037423786